MNRKVILISGVSLGLLLSVTTLAVLTCVNHGRKVSVSFVNSEDSNGQFPDYLKSERLAFVVRGAGSKHASFVVCAIEDEHGNWIPCLHILGDVEEGPSTQLYLYLPVGSHSQSVRIRMLCKASVVQKAHYAVRLLMEKASGRYSGKQVWFDGLKVPAQEFIVRLGIEAKPAGSRHGGSAPRLAIERYCAGVAEPGGCVKVQTGRRWRR